jgi:hypothetical protein
MYTQKTKHSKKRGNALARARQWSARHAAEQQQARQERAFRVMLNGNSFVNREEITGPVDVPTPLNQTPEVNPSIYSEGEVTDVSNTAT